MQIERAVRGTLEIDAVTEHQIAGIHVPRRLPAEICKNVERSGGMFRLDEDVDVARRPQPGRLVHGQGQRCAFQENHADARRGERFDRRRRGLEQPRVGCPRAAPRLAKEIPRRVVHRGVVEIPSDERQPAERQRIGQRVGARRAPSPPRVKGLAGPAERRRHQRITALVFGSKNVHLI